MSITTCPGVFAAPKSNVLLADPTLRHLWLAAAMRYRKMPSYQRLVRKAIPSSLHQARKWLDLDLMGVATGRVAKSVGGVPMTKSHNGVVAACALQCICQLELVRGGR